MNNNKILINGLNYNYKELDDFQCNKALTPAEINETFGDFRYALTNIIVQFAVDHNGDSFYIEIE